MRSVLYLQRVGVAGWEERKGDGAMRKIRFLHTSKRASQVALVVKK